MPLFFLSTATHHPRRFCYGEIDTAVADDWKSLLERYLGFQQDDYGDVPPSASEAEIEWLGLQARSLQVFVAVGHAEFGRLIATHGQRENNGGPN